MVKGSKSGCNKRANHWAWVHFMAGDLTQVQGGDERKRAQHLSMQRTHPPTEVPGYEPEECLGAGAYGEVWVAVDRNTGRRVAIKFYSQRGGLDWSQLAREVEKLAFLTGDRYVVQLIEVGWQSDPPYYVMEFMEYGSLEDRLEAGPLPTSEAVKIVRDVAVGLVHAHGKGVLHCDLKPANVLLDQDSCPRLADFGQSRLTNEQTPALGTLFYMAPSPDAGWDVYALGALLYRMLTGEPPFKSPDLVQKIEQSQNLEDRLQLYRDAIKRAPRPTAHRRVAGVDRLLADIIDRCLSVDSRRRFSNAQAVLDALDARAARRARRPLIILGALGPALLLAVMGTFALRAFNTSVRQSTTAVTSRALDSQRFAAQFVAQAYARGMEQRFRAVEQAAQNVELLGLLETYLEDESFRDLIRKQQDRSLSEAEHAKALDDFAQHPLQRWLEDKLLNNPDVPASASWFLTDAQGIQIARAPLVEETKVGSDYSYRDYFNGEEFPAGSHVDKMIDSPHRSRAFVSTTSQQLIVAFSVPVRAGGEKVALLAMTVELGKFAELGHQTMIDPGDPGSQIAVLIDNAHATRGQVLQHPLFAPINDLIRTLDESESLPLKPLQQQLKEARVHDHVLKDIPEESQAETMPPLAVTDYRDPLLEKLHELHVPLAAAVRQVCAGRDAAGKAEIEEKLANLQTALQHATWRSDQHWLAAVDGVVVKGRTDWIVIVQEPYAAAVAPVEALRSSLLATGLWGTGLSMIVLTGLWGMVSLLLYGSRSPLLNRIRRRVGLPSDSLSGGTARSGATSHSSTNVRTRNRSARPPSSVPSSTQE